MGDPFRLEVLPTASMLVAVALCAGCSLVFEGAPADSGLADSGPDTDASTTPNSTCWGLQPLAIDFTTTSPDQPGPEQRWKVSYQAGVSFSQSVLGARFDFETGSQGRITSVFEHDLTDDELVVVMRQVATTGSTAIGLDFDTRSASGVLTAEIVHSGGRLKAYIARTELFDRPYDAVDDRVWRIRASGPNFFFETGPTVQDLVVHQQTQQARNFDASHVVAVLEAYDVIGRLHVTKNRAVSLVLYFHDGWLRNIEHYSPIRGFAG